MLPRRTFRATSRTAKKPANSLVNPWVSRMNSSAKQISPVGRLREIARARPIFPCSGRLCGTSLETVPSPPAPGRNMPSTVWVRQGGKLPRRKRACRFRMRHKSKHGISEYQPARIEDELPDMVFYTVDTQAEPPRLTIQSDGTRMSAAYGNTGKGRYLDEYLGARLAPMVMPVYKARSDGDAG